MHELLPLSWTRIACLRPVYRDVTLPLSRTRRITNADIPRDYTLQILYEDLTVSYPDGYVFRGCTPETGAYFAANNGKVMRTGAEAVLDLNGPHLERKTVQSSLVRGKKQGVVEEIVLSDLNRKHFEQFRRETKHADKPQLQYLFRAAPSRECRCFVFRAFSGQWLAAITISKRGRAEVHTELMLRHRNAPGDIMECLVAGIFGILRDEGIREWSLSEVPFIMLMQSSREPLTQMEQLMVSIISRCRHAYDFEGLYRFKNKFEPIWRPVMLCTNTEPTPVMLMELASSMGFTNLLLHESFAFITQIIKSA